MAAVTLEALHLSKRYGNRNAVEDVSFVARSGDVVGFLGPNGAGKTTTIRLLTTVLAPTSGTFRVAGQPPTAAAEIRRRVGVLPESSGYPRHQTGRGYLRYHARLYGMGRSAAREVADRLLAELGLDERAGSPISAYSRGMRQRLGIARALVHDPVVVFLDEPTLGLDPAGQSQVLAIIRDIAQRRGATVVLSTHTLPEVEEVCSSVLILDRGKVQVFDTVGKVIELAGVELSAQLRVATGHVQRASLARRHSRTAGRGGRRATRPT
jgi:ABC-2 type transport system ATP-binding protein